MKLKSTILIGVGMLFFTSCQQILYSSSYGNSNQTQVVLSNANYNVLGSYTGTEIALKGAILAGNKEGLMSRAKKDLLANAKKDGIEMTGSRALINVTVDYVEGKRKMKVVVSAEIIEFTK